MSANPTPIRRIRWRLGAAGVPDLLDRLEEAGLAVAAFAENDAAEPEDVPWIVEILFGDASEAAGLRARVTAAARGLGLPLEELETACLRDADWLAITARSFPPRRIGRFWVRGSHVAEPAPPDAIVIRVDAGLAFGSGEHATTEGCLRAMERLADEGFAPWRALDLGCGSAILAIGAAKLWRIRVLAADNDPRAVAVAAANAADNDVADRITAVQSEGFACETIAASGPYDLILANILAEPLVELARGMADHLAPGGRAVLSGLLGRQAERVGDAYREVGLPPVATIDRDGWTTFVCAGG